MVASSAPANQRLNQLLDAVARLSPEEQLEFQRRLDTLHKSNGLDSMSDGVLIERARACLPAASASRLRRLIRKSEAGILTPVELVDYQALARQAEQIDVVRLQALTELSRRWGKSTAAVQKALKEGGLVNGR